MRNAFAGKEEEPAYCRQDVNGSLNEFRGKSKSKKPKNDADKCVQGNEPDNQVYAQIQGLSVSVSLSLSVCVPLCVSRCVSLCLCLCLCQI